jgi:hypothetical protein
MASAFEESLRALSGLSEDEQMQLATRLSYAENNNADKERKQLEQKYVC